MKKILAVLATLIIGLTGGTLVASPAQAVIGCPSGALCVYDSNYTSAVPIWDIDGVDFNPNGCVTLGISLRNRIVYIWNRSSYQFTAYTGHSCLGTAGPIYAYSQGNMTGVYYQTIDSFRRVG